MNFEQQICSADLAKRLKELGVKQESLFGWKPERGHRGINEHLNGWRLVSYVLTDDVPSPNNSAAFSVAELGEIMKGKGMGVTAYSSLTGGEWWVRGGEWIVEKQQYSHLETGSKWADILAKMLIYLLENKLITV